MRFMTVSLRGGARGNGEVQREGAAAIGLAVDAHEAVMTAHRVIDDSQAETAALWATAKTAVDAIKFAEDTFLLAACDADPVVDHAHAHMAIGAADVHLDIARFARVFHGVCEEIF